MSNKMQSVIVAGFLVFLLIVGVVLGLVWVSRNNSPVNVGSDNLTKSAPPLTTTTRTDPEGGESEQVIAVPPERVPDDFEGRLTAAPIEILPLQTDVLQQQTAVPEDEKQKINATLAKFIPAWDTFNPRTNPDLYRQKLRPYAYDEGVLGTIFSREDSIDPQGVCPNYGLESDCVVGSEWAAQGYRLADSSYFIDYDGTRAYVVGFGLVRFTGDSDVFKLAGETSDRAYGVILRKRGERWLIERIAGQSFEPGFDSAETPENSGEAG